MANQFWAKGIEEEDEGEVFRIGPDTPLGREMQENLDKRAEEDLGLEREGPGVYERDFPATIGEPPPTFGPDYRRDEEIPEQQVPDMFIPDPRDQHPDPMYIGWSDRISGLMEYLRRNPSFIDRVMQSLKDENEMLRAYESDLKSLNARSKDEAEARAYEFSLSFPEFSKKFYERYNKIRTYDPKKYLNGDRAPAPRAMSDEEYRAYRGAIPPAPEEMSNEEFRSFQGMMRNGETNGTI
jgi:hypothetical protein